MSEETISVAEKVRAARTDAAWCRTHAVASQPLVLAVEIHRTAEFRWQADVTGPEPGRTDHQMLVAVTGKSQQEVVGKLGQAVAEFTKETAL